MDTAVVGIDCACDPGKVGISMGAWAEGAVSVTRLEVGKGKPSPVERVVSFLRGHSGRALIAMDAPLGWPAPLGDALATHRAGNPLHAKAHDLFRRRTDQVVKRVLGKRALDVGADRIARTAHAALVLLGELRERLGAEIPLAWDPAFRGVAAIEVYPAATQVAHGLVADKNTEDGRRSLIEQLRRHLRIECDATVAETNTDAVDAIVCALAAKDFLAGSALQPEDKTLAEREGWIWFRAP